MSVCRVILVIEAQNERRGDGTPRNPVRILRQYFAANGELLAEVDPHYDALDVPAFERNVTNLLDLMEQRGIRGDLDGMIDGLRKMLRRGRT